MQKVGNNPEIEVLLADACPTVLLGLRAVLQDTGGANIVGEASDQRQTLHLISELQPEWVVVDPAFGRGATAPHQEGVHWADLCREIKARPNPPGIVVYTGHNSPTDLAALILAGADHYVHKSLELEQLAEARKRIREGERVWLPGPRPEEPPSGTVVTPEGVILTPREQEVLALKLRRYTNAEIARELHISLNTVKHHVTSIRRKRGRIRRRLR